MTRPSDKKAELNKWWNLLSYGVKLKESEMKDKYLNLARELKKLWNMKVTLLPILVGCLATITKGLVQEMEDLKIRGRGKTIRTIAFIKVGQNTEDSPRDFRRL